jgi:hypothetical protein
MMSAQPSAEMVVAPSAGLEIQSVPSPGMGVSQYTGLRSLLGSTGWVCDDLA